MTTVIAVHEVHRPLHPRLEALGRALRSLLGMGVWTGMVWGPVWFVSNVQLGEHLHRLLAPLMPFLQGWPPVLATAVLAGLAGRFSAASPFLALGLAVAAQWYGLTPIALGLLCAAAIAALAFFLLRLIERRRTLRITAHA